MKIKHALPAAACLCGTLLFAGCGSVSDPSVAATDFSVYPLTEVIFIAGGEAANTKTSVSSDVETLIADATDEVDSAGVYEYTETDSTVTYFYPYYIETDWDAADINISCEGGAAGSVEIAEDCPYVGVIFEEPGTYTAEVSLYKKSGKSAASAFEVTVTVTENTESESTAESFIESVAMYMVYKSGLSYFGSAYDTDAEYAATIGYSDTRLPNIIVNPYSEEAANALDEAMDALNEAMDSGETLYESADEFKAESVIYPLMTWLYTGDTTDMGIEEQLESGKFSLGAGDEN